MSWTLTEGYNSDTKTTGDLHGQDGWSGNVGFDVQNTVVSEGDQAVEVANSVDGFIALSITGVAAGQVSFQGRNSVTNSNGCQVQINETTTQSTYAALIRFASTGKIIRFINAVTEDVQAYSAGVWYTIVFDFDCATDQYRMKIDGGAYGTWENFYQNHTYTTLAAVILASNGGSGTSYHDDIKPAVEEVPPSGPTRADIIRRFRRHR